MSDLQNVQWDSSTRGEKMAFPVGKTIFKYQVPVQERFTMKLPAGAEIIRLAGHGGMFWLWAIVDTTAPDEDRLFHAFKTGGKIPPDLSLSYIGCCALFIQMELMLYIFEETTR